MVAYEITSHPSKTGDSWLFYLPVKTWKSWENFLKQIRCLFHYYLGGESWNHLACLSMTICRFLCLNASSISFLYWRAQGYSFKIERRSLWIWLWIKLGQFTRIQIEATTRSGRPHSHLQGRREEIFCYEKLNVLFSGGYQYYRYATCYRILTFCPKSLCLDGICIGITKISPVRNTAPYLLSDWPVANQY